MQHILSLVRRCVEDYNMIESGDTVAVGVSGGKDSVLTLAALAKLRSFYPKRFEVAAVTIDSGAPGMDFTPIARLCQELEVPYHLVSVPIYEIIFVHRQEKNPCSLCAKLRRGALSTELNRLGLNKIALGHHYDDAVGYVYLFCGLRHRGGHPPLALLLLQAPAVEGVALDRAKDLLFQLGELLFQLNQQLLRLLPLGGAVGGAWVGHHRQAQPPYPGGAVHKIGIRIRVDAPHGQQAQGRPAVELIDAPGPLHRAADNPRRGAVVQKAHQGGHAGHPLRRRGHGVLQVHVGP